MGWVRKKIRANWKIAQDAFQEAYHEVETHWDAMAYLAGSHTRYDVWDDEHSQVLDKNKRHCDDSLEKRKPGTCGVRFCYKSENRITGGEICESDGDKNR